MRLTILFMLGLGIGSLFSSCSNDDSSNVKEENKVAIEQYLEENNLTAQSTDSGLYYIIEEEGNGNHPTLSNRVTVTYKGYNLSGEVFDQSQEPISFGLRQVITGWREGIPKFSEGGKGKLFIPSHLAYNGSRPSYNQPIVFDVELISFE